MTTFDPLSAVDYEARQASRRNFSAAVLWRCLAGMGLLWLSGLFWAAVAALASVVGWVPTLLGLTAFAVLFWIYCAADAQEVE